MLGIANLNNAKSKKFESIHGTGKGAYLVYFGGMFAYSTDEDINTNN